MAVRVQRYSNGFLVVATIGDDRYMPLVSAPARSTRGPSSGLAFWRRRKRIEFMELVAGLSGYLNTGAGVGCRQRGHHLGLVERQRWISQRQGSFPASTGTNLAGAF